MLQHTDAKLAQAIKDGDVKLVDKVVKVKVGDDTKTITFPGIEAVTVKGAAAIMDGAIDTKDKDGNLERQSVLGAFNYGIDLFQRANARTKATAGIIDPAKALEGVVKALVKMGLSETAAREVALKQQALAAGKSDEAETEQEGAEA